MATKTTSERQKQPKKPLKGVTFSKDYQPSPEAKKRGWEQFRKERHLTQSIIKALLGDDGKPNQTFQEYIESLLLNARAGNPKAIDAVNKCLEEEVIKVAQTDPDGNAAKTELTDHQLEKLLNAITNPG